jgi:hypothetical protein
MINSTGWNLPPGVTLNDIDALFEESDEEQCLDTGVEDRLTEAPWEPTEEELDAMKALGIWTPIF